MDDLFPLPENWRSTLETYPPEAVLTVLGGALLLLLVLLVKKPRAVLRGLLVALVLVGGIGAVGIGAGTGRWADRSDQRDLGILAAVGGVLLVAALRLMRRLRKHLADRRLVDDVRDDPQRLVVLALAPELTVMARLRAVHALGDPFSLDAVARRSRNAKVKRRAKRRLEKLRRGTRPYQDDANPERAPVKGAQQETTGSEAGRPATPSGLPGEDLLPENFYLPPEE
jgi:hypothetical protein